MGEGNRSGFERGKLIEAGGECVIVEVDQVRGGGVRGRGSG